MRQALVKLDRRGKELVIGYSHAVHGRRGPQRPRRRAAGDGGGAGDDGGEEGPVDGGGGRRPCQLHRRQRRRRVEQPRPRRRAEPHGEELPAAMAQLPPAGRPPRQHLAGGADAHRRAPGQMGQQVVEDREAASRPDRQRDQELLENQDTEEAQEQGRRRRRRRRQLRFHRERRRRRGPRQQQLRRPGRRRRARAELRHCGAAGDLRGPWRRRRRRRRGRPSSGVPDLVKRPLLGPRGHLADGAFSPWKLLNHVLNPGRTCRNGL